MTDLTHIQSEQIAAWAIEAATSTPRTTIAEYTTTPAFEQAREREKDNG